jgi:hypothetical protein
MSNKDVKQDALDSLADALTEDILNTPDDELLREVEEDYGDPRTLANKFDQILERAEKQVFGTARSAASPQVRSSVLDLPYRLLEWFSTLFGSGPARSETQFQLFSVNRMVWAGAAAVLIVLILVPVVLSEFGERSRQLAALEKESLARLAALEKESLARSEQRAASEKEPVPATQVFSSAPQAPPPPDQNSTGLQATSKADRLAVTPPAIEPHSEEQQLTREQIAEAFRARIATKQTEIVEVVTLAQQFFATGQIATARQLLERPAKEGDATAALALGTTYDPIELEKLRVPDLTRPTANVRPPAAFLPHPAAPRIWSDIATARTWYQKAKDLGSIEAARRLESLAARESKSR